MRSVFLALAIAVFASSCTPIQPIEQPANGYRAIKFRQAISIRDHAINLYHFTAGSTFVADRVVDGYGTVYCGQAAINDAPQLWSICIGYKGPDTIVIGPGAFLKQVDRSVPTGAIEEINLKL